MHLLIHHILVLDQILNYLNNYKYLLLIFYYLPNIDYYILIKYLYFQYYFKK